MTPQQPKPTTSANTGPGRATTGHMTTGRPGCLVEGAVLASRVLVVGPVGWLISAAGVEVLAQWATDKGGWAGATVLFVDRPGSAQVLGRWWQAHAGPVVAITDQLGAVADVDVVVALLVEEDAAVLAVLERAGQLGVPAVVSEWEVRWRWRGEEAAAERSRAWKRQRDRR